MMCDALAIFDSSVLGYDIVPQPHLSVAQPFEVDSNIEKEVFY